MEPARRGPLAGLRVLEMAGIGPAPFCAMLLGDLGADVLRIDRPGGEANGLPVEARFDPTRRSRRSAAVDLKAPGAADLVLDLAARADVLLEGFRPGVMERLGLGPDACLARNPRLVYGRITGWGQDGPLAPTAGHDLTYLAVSGVLSAIGPAERPVPPLNLVGDFGGGALYLAVGVLAALREAERTGRGQVVDAAMAEGAASLAAMVFGLRAAGRWSDARAANDLDGGAPYYDTYLCADGAWIAVAPIEARFFAEFGRRAGLSAEEVAAQADRSAWPRLRARIAALIAARPRAEWLALFEGTDACVAPVLGLGDATAHPHMAARGAFLELDGVVQPAPAPRFSATPAGPPTSAPEPGRDTRAALADWGIAADRIDAGLAAGWLAQAP